VQQALLQTGYRTVAFTRHTKDALHASLLSLYFYK
jgi:hypothetical protein